MPAVNYRISSRQRKARAVERAKPAVRRRSDALKEESLKLYKGWFAGLILAPAAVISLFTVVEMFFQASRQSRFWRTEEFLFFLLGSAVWAGASKAGWRPVKSYVLAHELTHLLLARAFGGKIYDWQVSEEGGYVETNKSNIWITLGPYLVPFYTLIVLLVFGAAGLAWDLSAWRSVQFGEWLLPFRPAWLMYWLVGFSWCHHLSFTVQTIHREQGDLTRNGEFFSLMLIFLINVALIAAFFIVVSPSVSFAEAGSAWWGMAQTCWQVVTGLFAR